MPQLSISNNKTGRKLPAMTLIEILLAVSIISIITAVMIPMSQNLLYRDELNAAVNLTAKAVYMATQNARNGNGDEPWGVHVKNGEIIVFKGATFATRDGEYDLITKVNSRVSFSGDTEVVFNKLTGYPSGAVTILVSDNNLTMPVSVNTRGRLVY